MEFILFGDPFYNHIITCLNPVNLYNLCQTCKSYRNTITKTYFEKATIVEIKKRLENKYDKSNGGYISGDFIIQCILGEQWSGNIDLYLDNSQFRFWNLLMVYYLTGFELHRIHTNMGNFLEDEINFDICKNRYWYDNKDHIYIKSLNEILSKKTTFKCKKELSTNITNYYKYKNKGFSFYFDPDYEKLLNGLPDNNIKLYEVKRLSTSFKEFDKCENSLYIGLRGFHYYNYQNPTHLAENPFFNLRMFTYNNHSPPIYKYVKGDIDRLKKILNIGTRMYGCNNQCIIKLCNPNVKHAHTSLINNNQDYSDHIFIIQEN